MPKDTSIDDGQVDVEILEPIGTGVLATIHRVEIDQQVATAKNYPRNVTAIKQELTALVTMDEETAEECIYALPRGNKTINGPSARFADALISFWGNARSGAFIVQVDKEDKFVEAIGSFQDVERNVIRQRRVRRPISDKHGRLYNADMINMTGNAACVIAERNAILNGIPKSLWSGAYERAFSIVAGTTQTLGDKLARAKKGFLAMEIDFALVLEKLGRQDESKIVPQDIIVLRGMLTALKTGEETPESIFGRGAGSSHETVANPLKDKPAAGEKDPAPAREASGSSAKAAEASLVIEEDGSISKSGGKGAAYAADAVVIDKRFHADDQRFETFSEWENSLKPADLSNPLLEQDREPEPEADKTAEKPAGASEPEAGEKPAEGKNNARAARQTKTEAPKKDEPPYTDADSYLTFMRDGFDKAKSKAAINDLWATTRADRRELLGDTELEALEKDRDAANARVASKGAV